MAKQKMTIKEYIKETWLTFKDWWVDYVLGTQDGRAGLIWSIVLFIFIGIPVLAFLVLIWQVTLVLLGVALIITAIAVPLYLWVKRADY